MYIFLKKINYFSSFKNCCPSSFMTLGRCQKIKTIWIPLLNSYSCGTKGPREVTASQAMLTLGQYPGGLSELFSTKNINLRMLKSVSICNRKKPFNEKRNKIKMNSSKIVNNLDKLISIEYSLDNFHRSNQDTCLVHKPSVFEGQWIQSGDLLADCSASIGGELALGQNILIAYMPWEGYNFEDAILVSERLVYDDLYTSVHIERYEVELRETKLGIEEITREIPDIAEASLNHLNNFGIAKLGSWVEEGDILVGKVTPVNKKVQSNYQKLLYTILDKTVLPIRDSSLRAPKGIKAKVIGIQIFKNNKNISALNSTSNERFLIQKPPGSTHPFSRSKSELGAALPFLPGKKKKDGRAGKKLTNLSSPYSLNGRKQITIPKENVLPWHKISVQFKKIKKNSHINKNDSFFKAWQVRSDTDANPDLLARPPCKNSTGGQDLLIQQAGRELINLYSQNNILTVLGHNKFKFFSFNKSSLTILQQKLMNKQLQRKSYILKSMPEWHALKKEQIKKQNPKEVKKSKAYAAYSLNLNNFTPKQTNVRNTPCVRTRFVHLGKTSDNLHSFKNFFGCDFRQILTQEQLIPSFKLQEIGKAMKQQKPRLLKNKIMNLTTLSDSSQIKSQNKNLLNNVSSVQVYLAEKRRIQVGDKMAGRHGNKGIISQILPIEDMPFLPDGKPLDMVLNPLGVPSRMNVGQIYECLLGLAGKHLGENFKVFPFDEIYGAEASRSFVYSKLYEARFKTGKQWLFNQNSPGKIRLYDGRTGETFDQAITVGYAYMLRLVHMVDDKIHARSTGPYSLVTQQPLRGRSKQGGQRLGEMEVWALEGYGAAFTLLEMLTIKSDDMTGRMTLWSNLILNKEISIGTPESFKVLICELQALCLDIGLFKVE